MSYSTHNNRRATSSGNPVSLFPFLAVLLCTMGALISILLIIARQAQLSTEELIQEILDERARELAFEGHRWYDLRRTTQPALMRTYDGVTYTLTPEKYTMRFPTEAVEANPEIERWDYTK